MEPQAKTYNNISTVRFAISGMHCGNCALNVEKKFQNSHGVKSVVVNLTANTAVVAFDATQTNKEKLIHVLDGTQFSARIIKDSLEAFSAQAKADKQQDFKDDLIKLILAVALTIIIMFICSFPGAHMAVGQALLALFGINAGEAGEVSAMFAANILLFLLTIPVEFYCGATFISGAFHAIKNKALNMDVLIVVGTGIAFLYSVYITFEPLIFNLWDASTSQLSNEGKTFFETSAMLISFISFGELTESRAKSQTTQAVEALINLVPKEVCVLVSPDPYSKQEMKQIDFVGEGEFVLIDQNQNIPLDGKLVSGKSVIDESMLTGESDLQEKQFGDEVTGGTINRGSAIVVEVTRTYLEGTLAQIVRVVTDAQGSKAPVQRIADKVSGIFVPIVLLLTLAVFVLWLIFADGEIAQRVQHALLCACSITIVACPCALVLATPTALTVGIGKAAQLGVIIRDGAVLETLCKVRHMVFDKTGTLTKTNLETNTENAKILRDDAAKTVSALKSDFSVDSYMISGDVKDEALRVAQLVGIASNNVTFGADPVSKKDYLEKIMKGVRATDEGAKFAYIGDGVNDAPAMASADIGITLESGTDIALETGDVILMHNRLYDIITAIRLSNAVMRKIKQNMFWALIYNVVMIPLAALGFVLPIWCGAIHAVSSLLVVSNSLLLKRFK